MKDLTIVILNYNGANFLNQFLPTVLKYSEGYKVVVADNCSTDNSIETLQNQFPQVPLIQLSDNGGFAKGYNEALSQIDSEFYLLLNSDIEVCEGWIEPLLQTMEDPLVAGCQPKVKRFANKSDFEHAGAAGGFLDRDYYPFCRGRIFDSVEQDHGQYDDAIEIFWATGAALLIRSEVYHTLEGFDDDFFAHMEEIDLCWRAKKLGWKFMVQPKSVVYHVGGGTLSYASPFKTYLNFRNSLFMLIKNHEGPLFPKWFRRMVLDGLAGLRFIYLKEFKQLGALWRAHRDMYKSLPKMLRKRKALQQKAGHFNAVGLTNYSILWKRFREGITKFSEI
ncbi:MAG: glycosyltransferase family 2 protein [Bacteroidetes bacterium]|nr:glycosyltransferase family 2 protein [Bacteroidota bacterium]